MEHLPIGNVKHSYVYYTVKSFTFKEPPPPPQGPTGALRRALMVDRSK